MMYLRDNSYFERINPMPGEDTEKFGNWLENYIRKNEQLFRVFYDHGKSSSPSVGEIQGFVGMETTSKTILTNADVMVVDENDKVKILIEIEDKASLVPKKLIGSVFSSLLCTSFAFGTGKDKKHFSITPETIFIMAGQVSSKGNKFEQLEDVIYPKILECKLPDGGILAENVLLVFESDIATTIERLEERVKELLA
jgi:hypothetical protein